MKKYFIQTFGCEMNKADSEKINMLLFQSGFTKSTLINDANLVIFNTCSVRQKGEDRVFGMIREVRKNSKNNGKKVIIGITGCMIRKTGINSKYILNGKERDRAKKIELLENENGIFNNDDKLFPRVPDLDFTLRIEEIKYLQLILSHIYSEKIGTDVKFDDYLKSKQLRENPNHASIIIQTGCDNYCSFCIVPYTRGKEISRSKEDIIKDCQESVNSGAKEITLLGQNVNSYGKQFVDKKLWNEEKGKWNLLINQSPNNVISSEVERSAEEINNEFPKSNIMYKEQISPLQSEGQSSFKSPFRDLLEEINNIEGIDRIRFTSSNPHDMTQDILDSHFELPHMCNYMHFALQSGSNEMLKKMNRKHTYEDFKKQVDYLRSKDPYFSISTDIIVGFSGETDEMFEETIKAFEECKFDFAYIARYSVRPGTIASKIYPDNVPNNIKAERWHKLNIALNKSLQKRNEMMIGREEKILIYGEKDEQFYGRTRNFKEIFFDKDKKYKVGDIIDVKITELDRWVLKGKVVIIR